MPKNQTNKVKARTSRILKAVANNEDLDEVAKELGVTRRAISYNMASYDFQSSLAEFLAKDMEAHYATINEFLSSDDPLMQAEGMKEHGKMTRALIPKLIYKRSENENTTTVKMDRESYGKLTLDEQRQMAELLLKIGREADVKPAAAPKFVEAEYQTREEKTDADDDAGTGS